MIGELRDMRARLDRLEAALQRPTQEIRDEDGALRLRWGRQPDGEWTARAHDGNGALAGDLVHADPVGRVIFSTLPTVWEGWIVADGTTVQEEYPIYRQALLDAGSPHGFSSGHPHRPNLINRVLVGSGGSYVLGATGGAATHTLTAAQLPEHTHPIEVGHGGNAANAARVSGNGTGGTGVTVATWTAPIKANTGGGSAHNNMPPYVGLLPLIRAY